MTNTPVAAKMMLVDNILKLFEENTHNRKYAPGYFGLAQPIPQETTPTCRRQFLLYLQVAIEDNYYYQLTI